MCSECREVNCPYRQGNKKKISITSLIAIILVAVIAVAVAVSAIKSKNSPPQSDSIISEEMTENAESSDGAT